MATKKSSKELIKEISFSEMRKEWWKISWTNQKALTFLAISLIIFGITFGIWLLDGILCYALGIEWDSLLPSLVYNVISIIFSIWLLAFWFELINWRDVKVKDYWKWLTRDRIWKWVLGSMLAWVFVALGLLLFIIPWIIISVRLKFIIFAIIDKWLDPVEAVKYSRNITKWHFWEIIGFDFYFLFFNIIWMLCLIVWLIRTWPMTQLATTRYYKVLSAMYDNNQTVITEKD